MSFNVDDPLAGILSDGSDDSFFDDDILGKKKPARKKSTPTAEKKNALFDLGDTEKSKPIAGSEDRKDSSLDIIDLKKSPSPFKRNDSSKESIKFSQVEPKSKTSFEKLNINKSPAKSKVLSTSADKIDILSDLMEPKKDTSKQVEKGKSSQSLLDDILGTSTKTSSSRPVLAAKSQEFDINTFLGKGDYKTASSKSLPPPKPIFKEKEKKEDTPAQKTKSSEDWLEIFKDKEENNDFGDHADMPAWLVGDDSKKKKSEEKKSVSKQEIVKEKPKEEFLEQVQVPEENPPKPVETKIDIEPNIEINMAAPPKMLQGSNEDIATEGAALYLQQQESQIMLALQLKAQEEKLAAMQIRQKESQRVQREATQAQHAQLDAMLRNQAENRHQMQNIIAAHQERITQRIKALLDTDNVENEEEVTLENPDVPRERIQTPHSREKKQLLQLVQSLQENHDKEIDLMDTSFRRQLGFIEASLNQAEERMKDESEKLVRFYTEKLNWLDEHHQLYKKITEDNMAELTQRHKSENEMLRQQHLDNIKVLQEHHATLMENMKNAVKQEQAVIHDSVGFSTELNVLVSEVKDTKHHCQELVDKVQAWAENTERNNHNSIQVRESQINDMIQQLKKERENFDNEKAENAVTIKMLEARLKQMTTTIEEESAALKQNKMEFEFEKATFQKQTEFAKNILKKQDEEIKALRETIQKEYQDKIAQIEEEKRVAIKETASLAREKSIVQSSKQEIEKMKAELQVQLDELSEEKSKLDMQKQQMQLAEQRIMVKNRDLEIQAKTTMEKQVQADKKYAEAEFIQKKYEERIKRFQEHVVSLNTREKQIAREKVTLSRERLTLHNERKDIESRQQCSLCRSTQQGPLPYEPSYSLLDSFVHDPSVTKDFRSSNLTTTIEQQMSHLMRRNLNLRQSAAIGDLTHCDANIEEIQSRLTESTPAQVESGSFQDYNDPKFMMLRLDVQRVLSNLEHSKKENAEFVATDEPEEH